MPRKTTTTAQQTNGADKAEKFRKLASTRTQKSLDALDVLGNCFNRANYSYTDEQVTRIFDALEAKLDELRAKTQPDAPKAQAGFTL